MGRLVLVHDRLRGKLMEVPPLYEGTLLFVLACFMLVGLIVAAVCFVVFLA